jgi:hypothetical protein
MLSLKSPALQTKTFRHAYHTSVASSRKSMWKWAHRPDLRDFAGSELKELQTIASTDSEAAGVLYEARVENQRWMAKADPEEVAQRLLRLLKNSAYKLPNGYL